MIKYIFSLVLGVIFGAVVSVVYLMGSFAARPIIPYAVAVVLLIVALTILLILFRLYLWNGLYSKTIVIAAFIFIVIALFIVGTAVVPAGALKVVLTIIGATSFGVTVMTFIGFVTRSI